MVPWLPNSSAHFLWIFKDKQEKQFIYRHSRTVFDLMDEDGSNTISAEEFGQFGFIFNFHGTAVKNIFNEFDVSGDQVNRYLRLQWSPLNKTTVNKTNAFWDQFDSERIFLYLLCINELRIIRPRHRLIKPLRPRPKVTLLSGDHCIRILYENEL